MKKILIILLALALFSCDHSSSSKNKTKYSIKREQIYVNQVGYLINEEKYFLVDTLTGNFEIVKKSDDTTVFTGNTAVWKNGDPSSGMDLSIGYFTDLKTEGEYYVKMDNDKKSYNFSINNSVYTKVRDYSLKSFYYQRSGMALPSSHVGKFARSAGHTSNLAYHSSTPYDGDTKDVSGGWYDAGDYGRYITPAAVTLGVMLIGAEQYFDKFDVDTSVTQENGVGVEFLDEMKYELDWMLKMQNTRDDSFKGALPYMVNSKDYVWGMPSTAADSNTQYIYDFSSSATADFAGVMALASRVFKKSSDSAHVAYADTCLNAAKLAWEYLKTTSGYPAGGFQKPEDTSTGGYATYASDNSNDVDGRTWAAVELFLATGNTDYNDYAIPNLNTSSDFSMTWMNTMGFAKIQYMLGTQSNMDTTKKSGIYNSFINYCDGLINRINSDGFKTALSSNDYMWGSNGEVLNRALCLILADKITSDKKYYNGALSQLNYVLGMNGVNMSYVTKLGTVYPNNLHHAALATDGIDDSYPGLIAGGPNSRLSGDNTLPEYFDSSTPPALCYIDHVDSWASNENCILYNAPLIPVAAYFSN